MENIEFIKVQTVEELREFCLYPERELKKQPYFMVVHKFSKESWEQAYLYGEQMGWLFFIKFDTPAEEKAYRRYINAVYKKLGV